MQQGFQEGEAGSQVGHSWPSVVVPASLSQPSASASHHEAHSSQPTQ